MTATVYRVYRSFIIVINGGVSAVIFNQIYKEFDNMKKLISLLLAVVLSAVPMFTACDNSVDPDAGLDNGGNGGSVVGIKMWASGTDPEQETEFKAMVNAFNKSEYAKQNYVRLSMTWLSNDNYTSSINSGSAKSDGAVDIIFVNDRNFKKWADNGFIVSLNQYTNSSEYESKLSNMWSSIYPRFRYNADGNTSYDDDPLWGIPVDTSPTALYYNRQAMENCGVIVISVDDDVVTAANYEEYANEYNGLTRDMIGSRLMDLWNANKIEDKFGQKHDTCGNRGSEDTGAGFEADVLKDREIIVPEKGYYREDGYNFIDDGTGTDAGWINPNDSGVTTYVKVFNASIAMNWDECEDLALLLTKTKNKENHGRSLNGRSVDTNYGYYTEWWFNYGWSVGGDCLQDLTGEGTWAYGLNDWSTNYKVTAAGDGYVGRNTGTVYHEGDTLEMIDKLNIVKYGPSLTEDGGWEYDDDNQVIFNDGDLLLPSADGGFEIYDATTKSTKPLGNNSNGDVTNDSEILPYIVENSTDDITKDPDAKFVALPSTRAALTRYISNIKKGTMPLPTSFSNSSTVQQFGNGDIAMVVERGYQIGLIRSLTKGYGIEWGVAPLPQYKEYANPESDDTTVVRTGVNGGHSEATALCIAAGSKNKNLAWKVIEWLTSDYMTVKGQQEAAGQIYKAEAGFIPNQPSVASSSTFIKEDEKNLNLDIFFDVLEFERAGDWWYLPDNAWINIWATPLNSEVRNGSMTAETWFTNYALNCTKELIDYSYYYGSDTFKTIFTSHFN